MQIYSANSNGTAVLRSSVQKHIKIQMEAIIQHGNVNETDKSDVELRWIDPEISLYCCLHIISNIYDEMRMYTVCAFVLFSFRIRHI